MFALATVKMLQPLGHDVVDKRLSSLSTTCLFLLLHLRSSKLLKKLTKAR